MNNEYNQAVANHYSAYRPPLHSIILSLLIPENAKYGSGLDVGCGTGYSTIALAKYCSQVFGVEPSESMLEKVTGNARTSYLKGTGESLPIPDKSIEVATFAGSLNYIDSLSLTAELRRVCLSNALVIAYDFEVLFDESLTLFDIDPDKKPHSYNHAANFSNSVAFDEITARKEKQELEVSSMELAHLLLSSLSRHDLFVEKYGVKGPLIALLSELNQTAQSHKLEADIYYSSYRLKE